MKVVPSEVGPLVVTILVMEIQVELEWETEKDRIFCTHVTRTRTTRLVQRNRNWEIMMKGMVHNVGLKNGRMEEWKSDAMKTVIGNVLLLPFDQWIGGQTNDTGVRTDCVSRRVRLRVARNRRLFGSVTLTSECFR